MSLKLRLIACGLLILAGCDAGGPAPAPTTPAQTPPPPRKASSSTTGAPAATKADETKPAADKPADEKPADAAPTPEAKSDQSASPVAAAMELVANGELSKAVELLKNAEKAGAKDRELTLALAQFSTFYAVQKLQTENYDAAAPLFVEAAKYARTFAKDHAPLSEKEAGLVGMALYNDACVSAKSNKVEDTVKTLDEAIGFGFTALAQVDADEDFNSVRDNDAFKAWRKQAEEKVAARVIADVKKELASNKPFPFDFALTDYDGQPRKLADFKGKVLIVDLWATWCGPCREEIPHLIALHKKYQAQGLEIIGINYENEQPADAAGVIKKFATENGMTYPCVIGDEATQEKVPEFVGFPTMLFLDRTGTVRLKRVGYTEHNALEAIVTSLLNEKAESE